MNVFRFEFINLNDSLQTLDVVGDRIVYGKNDCFIYMDCGPDGDCEMLVGTVPYKNLLKHIILENHKLYHRGSVPSKYKMVLKGTACDKPFIDMEKVSHLSWRNGTISLSEEYDDIGWKVFYTRHHVCVKSLQVYIPYPQ